MNTELYLEIKKIISNGCRGDYYRLYESKEETLQAQKKLCAIYFKGLSTIAKFDYISEMGESYKTILFNKIELSLNNKGTNSTYFSQSVGMVLIHGLVDRLNETLCDIFNEHYEQYKINECNKLLCPNNYKLNEDDLNWVNDYKLRKKDMGV